MKARVAGIVRERSMRMRCGRGRRERRSVNARGFGTLGVALARGAALCFYLFRSFLLSGTRRRTWSQWVRRGSTNRWAHGDARAWYAEFLSKKNAGRPHPRERLGKVPGPEGLPIHRALAVLAPAGARENFSGTSEEITASPRISGFRVRSPRC